MLGTFQRHPPPTLANDHRSGSSSYQLKQRHVNPASVGMSHSSQLKSTRNPHLGEQRTISNSHLLKNSSSYKNIAVFAQQPSVFNTTHQNVNPQFLNTKGSYSQLHTQQNPNLNYDRGNTTSSRNTTGHQQTQQYHQPQPSTIRTEQSSVLKTNHHQTALRPSTSTGGIINIVCPSSQKKAQQKVSKNERGGRARRKASPMKIQKSPARISRSPMRKKTASGTTEHTGGDMKRILNRIRPSHAPTTNFSSSHLLTHSTRPGQKPVYTSLGKKSQYPHQQSQMMSYRSGGVGLRPSQEQVSAYLGGRPSPEKYRHLMVQNSRSPALKRQSSRNSRSRSQFRTPKSSPTRSNRKSTAKKSRNRSASIKLYSPNAKTRMTSTNINNIGLGQQRSASKNRSPVRFSLKKAASPRSAQRSARSHHTNNRQNSSPSRSKSGNHHDYSIKLKWRGDGKLKDDSVPVFRTQQEMAEAAAKKYLKQVKMSAQEVQNVNMKLFYNKNTKNKQKNKEDLTLDGLKKSMHYSIAMLENNRDSPMNFQDLVMGFSERVNDIANDMVDEQVRKERDRNMMLKIADMKRKRLNGAQSARTTAKSTPRSRSRTSSPRKSKSPRKQSKGANGAGAGAGAGGLHQRDNNYMTARDALNSGTVIFRSPSARSKSSMKKKKSQKRLASKSRSKSKLSHSRSKKGNLADSRSGKVSVRSSKMFSKRNSSRGGLKKSGSAVRSASQFSNKSRSRSQKGVNNGNLVQSSRNVMKLYNQQKSPFRLIADRSPSHHRRASPLRQSSPKGDRALHQAKGLGHKNNITSSNRVSIQQLLKKMLQKSPGRSPARNSRSPSRRRSQKSKSAQKRGVSGSSPSRLQQFGQMILAKQLTTPAAGGRLSPRRLEKQAARNGAGSKNSSPHASQRSLNKTFQQMQHKSLKKHVQILARKSIITQGYYDDDTDSTVSSYESREDCYERVEQRRFHPPWQVKMARKSAMKR